MGLAVHRVRQRARLREGVGEGAGCRSGVAWDIALEEFMALVMVGWVFFRATTWRRLQVPRRDRGRWNWGRIRLCSPRSG